MLKAREAEGREEELWMPPGSDDMICPAATVGVSSLFLIVGITITLAITIAYMKRS